MLPKPRAILFDLDGTLVDTVPTRIEAWSRALAEARLPFERSALGRLIGSDGTFVVREFSRAAGIDVDESRADAIDHRSGEIYDGLNTDPRPLPGVGELLAAIRAADLPWAIATSSRAAQVGRSVRALGLDRKPTIVDGSSVAHAKPAPDLMLKAASTLGIEPGDCWYIGDSIWDMRAGIAAGMTTVGVTAGAAVSESELRDAGARLVVATALDVVPLLHASADGPR
jgi:HAD superfamily hydrolase (TIGR01509 family)